MKAIIPDHGTVNFPKQLGVEEVRRILVQSGYTQVEGATATVSDGGNTITFSRNLGGAKA